MCAFFYQKLDADFLSLHFAINNTGLSEIDLRILPHSEALVIVGNDSSKKLKKMNFSLIPNWSKTRKVKFATHNARLFSDPDANNKIIPIYEKPTWCTPFSKRHCLVPLTTFIEPIYVNQYAGNMVNFSKTDDTPLVAAGIWDEWVNKETGEIIESFAILTHEPPKFVREIGHDRCPVFLTNKSQSDWPSLINIAPSQMVQYLIENQAEIDFKVSIDRPLKEGWQKRIP
ncbi:MAG: SOS response-associated peptidase family protein [Bacteriovoracaceae bacterium]|nr:SOS response-associated peptidase family protein [Bacteriovoracaceae bacterium]